MRVARLSSILPLFTFLPLAIAIRKPGLRPGGKLPPNYLDSCEIQCNIDRYEHTRCTVDCPPSAAVNNGGSITGNVPASSFPTGAGIRTFANRSLATVTSYITTIPPFCLPGGPDAPIANVPTTSISNAEDILSAISEGVASAESEYATAAMTAATTTVPAATVKQENNIATPAPIGGVGVPGFVTADGTLASLNITNATTYHFKSGSVPTPTSEAGDSASTSEVESIENTQGVDVPTEPNTTPGRVPSNAGSPMVAGAAPKTHVAYLIGLSIAFVACKLAGTC